MAMLEAYEVVEEGFASAMLELPFESRQKSRLRASLNSGQSIGLFLPRGSVLRSGTLLRATDGTLVEVRAAAEAVSTVSSGDHHLLMRVAYHLGNRHVPLQIEPGFVRYQHDHVLDDMVAGLGATVHFEHVPFEPEPGAYSGQHSHDGSHHHQHADPHPSERHPGPLAQEIRGAEGGS